MGAAEFAHHDSVRTQEARRRKVFYLVLKTLSAPKESALQPNSVFSLAWNQSWGLVSPDALSAALPRVARCRGPARRSGGPAGLLPPTWSRWLFLRVRGIRPPAVQLLAHLGAACVAAVHTRGSSNTRFETGRCHCEGSTRLLHQVLEYKNIKS